MTSNVVVHVRCVMGLLLLRNDLQVNGQVDVYVGQKGEALSTWQHINHFLKSHFLYHLNDNSLSSTFTSKVQFVGDNKKCNYL